MVYIDLRHTPPADYEERFKESHMVMVNAIINYFKDLNSERQSYVTAEHRAQLKYLVVCEEHNKFGEKTHLHYHINMELFSDSPYVKPYRKDSLAKALNRNLGLKGNAMYCLRVHTDPDNIERWWRYCCKQHIPIDNSDHFSEDELVEMNKIAKAEYEQRVVENNQTRDKMINKNNFRQKLMKHLHECLDSRLAKGIMVSDKLLWIAIAEYYRKNHTTPPFMKMDDLVVDVKVELKYITLEEYYDIKH